MKNKPQPDAVEFAHFERVRKTLDHTQGGIVTAFVTRPGCLTYMVKFADGEEECYGAELELGEALDSEA